MLQLCLQCKNDNYKIQSNLTLCKPVVIMAKSQNSVFKILNSETLNGSMDIVIIMHAKS